MFQINNDWQLIIVFGKDGVSNKIDQYVFLKYVFAHRVQRFAKDDGTEVIWSQMKYFHLKFFVCIELKTSIDTFLHLLKPLRPLAGWSAVVTNGCLIKATSFFSGSRQPQRFYTIRLLSKLVQQPGSCDFRQNLKKIVCKYPPNWRRRQWCKLSKSLPTIRRSLS